VKTANSAYQALDLVDHTDIGVAILDIKMYPIDGIAFLVESKKRSPSTQVIMMTGFLRRKQQMGEKNTARRIISQTVGYPKN